MSRHFKVTLDVFVDENKPQIFSDYDEYYEPDEAISEFFDNMYGPTKNWEIIATDVYTIEEVKDAKTV